MAASGQTKAQLTHPVQGVLLAWAGKYPFLFDSLEKSMQPLGHAFKQSPHPLHLSESTAILPAILPFFILTI